MVNILISITISLPFKIVIMKALPFKKLSILSLVLLGVSAVTAAIVPTRNDKDEVLANTGHVSISTAGLAAGYTCSEGPGAVGQSACNTTEPPEAISSTTGGGFTAANATNSSPS
jgi:hypothetical protein